MNRSSNGCWTCRIRHRKCDELRPICKECSDRYIPCHGYGPRPPWLDNQLLLHAELTQIKHAVKENFRRNKRLRRGFPKSSMKGKEISPAIPRQQPSPDLPSSALYTTRSLSPPESQLLVHYLDYIFPLQYPYYVDKPELGGRGWLPWLLLRSGPLHQAILTLSTLHRYTKIFSQTGEMERELIRYHTKALQDLRETICHYNFDGPSTDKEPLVEFMACGLNLMSFEVFRGGTAGWQPHLHALTAVVNKLATSLVYTESTLDIPLDCFLIDQGNTDIALRFLVENMIWFDILGSSSMGISPTICLKFWLEDQGLDLSHVMGCENWVMTTIGDIAAMNARVSSLDCGILGDALSIKQRLDAGLKQLEADPKPPTSKNLLISRVFITSALVELLSICPNVSSSDKAIRDAVADVMDAIRLLPESLSLRGLTWSICVTGSKAEEDQQPFFEALMLRILGESRPGFSNCDTVWSIIKESWDRRKSHPTSCNWRDAMKAMGICALLV